MKKTTWLMALLLPALLLSGGCIFSPDEPGGGGGTPPPTVPFPDTRDKLMTNFRTAYESMDFDIYSELIHPDYITILQQSTRDQYPDVGEFLDLAEELRIHQRMFSGLAQTDPDGIFVPGVANISFQAFERQDEWKTSTEPQIPDLGDPDHPVERALYDVIFLFDRGQTYSTLKVQGQIEFFITSKDSLHNGATRKYYMMRGQKDQTDE